MLKKLSFAAALCGLTLGLVTATPGDLSDAHAGKGSTAEIHLTDITTPLVPNKLIAGDREFGGNGPNIVCRVQLKLTGDRQRIVAVVDFQARETKSDWSETRGNWTVNVFTAPAGKKIDHIIGPTTSEVRFISKQAGFQILGPGEDFVKFIHEVVKFSNRVLDAERLLTNLPVDTPEVRAARELLKLAESASAGLHFEGNYVHTVHPKVDGPVNLFSIVGDTGGPDISTDNDPKDDTRIQAIHFSPIRVVYQIVATRPHPGEGLAWGGSHRVGQDVARRLPSHLFTPDTRARYSLGFSLSLPRMDEGVDRLMGHARPRADLLDRERIAAEVYAVLFGAAAPVVEIGRFVVESRIGSGGMGIVYRGYDPELDRRVAIKVLDLRRVSAEPAVARERLQREARALAQLTHPNVVSVYDVGLLDESGRGDPAPDAELEPRLYLVMEYIDGPTLRAWMRGDHDLDARLALLLGAGRGLAAAHAANLIHGDFKPDNILVGPDGRARVADFGLALPILESEQAGLAQHERARVLESSAESNFEPEDPTGVTLSGVVGTPAYIAPEQLLGVRIDARADQFAFCVVACELLYGRRPFEGDNLEALTDAATTRRLVSLDDSRIPRATRAALIRGLSPDPAERFANIDALLGAIEAGFVHRKRRRAAAAATVLLGAIGLGAWLGFGPAPAPTPGPACVAAEARLEGVWNRERAASIEARLEAADGRGAASATMLVARLDQHATQWGAAWTESCADRGDPGDPRAHAGLPRRPHGRVRRGRRLARRSRP